ncbi:MAG: galactokinase [Acidobacteria bacterium]|nr:galactokinase [Acidobacteriota bacterium]
MSAPPSSGAWRCALREGEETFHAIFGRDEELSASAPGRVNLIGEHTDYNEGFVLPIAIPQRTTVRLARRDDRLVRVWSANTGRVRAAIRTFELGHEALAQAWVDYVQGVTWALREEGCAIGGVDVAVASDVPLGSGLSSSAALEVGVLRALSAAFSLELDGSTIARLAHRAETGFVGVPVGVMDQMASSLASEDAALFIDTRTLAFEHVPLPASAQLLVINSGITHAHAGGEYRTRRSECEAAARALGLRALRDADRQRLTEVLLPEPLNRRARHVVTEDDRVLEMRAALLAGDLATAGALMNDSHRSMSEDFEVSTPEVDVLVRMAQAQEGVFGARMTGGGFGGCIVALCAHGTARDAGARALRAYTAETGRAGRLLIPEA